MDLNSGSKDRDSQLPEKEIYGIINLEKSHHKMKLLNGIDSWLRRKAEIIKNSFSDLLTTGTLEALFTTILYKEQIFQGSEGGKVDIFLISG